LVRGFGAVGMMKSVQIFYAWIDDSPYRRDWFDFRTQAYVGFVREQVGEDRWLTWFFGGG